MPRPRAILVVSAHWYINASAVTAMARPRTIHDFYGFPDELFAVEYPAPGDPELAEEVAEVVKPTWVGLDHDSWGIDHGTWSVLVHAFPEADIPVVQLSINAAEAVRRTTSSSAPRWRRCATRGVLIVGSGNVVHNLRRIDWQQPDAAFDWARRFDDEAAGDHDRDTGRHRAVGGAPGLRPGGADARPLPPAALPRRAGRGRRAKTADVLVDGYAMGSLSMISYTVGGAEVRTNGGDGAPTLPPVPADETNV